MEKIDKTGTIYQCGPWPRQPIPATFKSEPQPAPATPETDGGK
jgi:hypothetical protein